MPQLTALTVNDGATTPVARTFAAQEAINRIAMWLEKTAGIAIGYIRITDEYRKARSASAANSRIIGVELPTVAVVNGVSTRVRVSSAQVRLNHAQDATDQEKKDLLAYTANFLLNATEKSAIINEEPWF